MAWRFKTGAVVKLLFVLYAVPDSIVDGFEISNVVYCKTVFIAKRICDTMEAK